MGAPGRQPAADRRVEARVSARQPALGRTAFETTTGGYPGDAFPQPGERGGRLAHHLFLICSISARVRASRSEEHTSELQSLMRISSAVFCLTKKKTKKQQSKETE